MTKSMTMQEAIRNAAKVKAGASEATTLPVGNVTIPKEAPAPTVNVVKAVDKVEVKPAPVVETTTNTEVAAPQQAPILTLAQLEKLYILDILKRTGNNKTRAAEMLGVSLKTIYNKLASYGAEGQS